VRVKGLTSTGMGCVGGSGSWATGARAVGACAAASDVTVPGSAAVGAPAGAAVAADWSGGDAVGIPAAGIWFLELSLAGAAVGADAALPTGPWGELAPPQAVSTTSSTD